MIPQFNEQTTFSNELGELFSALAKAQGKINNALKDKINPFYKSSYADLASVWNCCREPLSTNGLAIVQFVEGNKEEMVLVTMLGHSSGQWMKSRLPLFIGKKDSQGVAAAMTYAKRCALSAMVGVCADDDDDGELSVNRNKSREDETPKKSIVNNVPIQKEPVLTQKEIENVLDMKILPEEKELWNEYVKHNVKLKKDSMQEKDILKNILIHFEATYQSFQKWKEKQKIPTT